MATSLSGSSSQSQDAANNTSAVGGSATVTMLNTNPDGMFAGMQSYGRVTIGGVNYDTAGPTAMYEGDTWSFSASRPYTHDIAGARGAVDVTFSFWVDGTSFHASSASASQQPSLNYDRKPAATTNVVATVATDKSVSVAFTGGASPGGTPALTSTYHVSYSKDGGAFTGDVQKTSSPIVVPAASLSAGSNYVFRVWATNASTDGNGTAGDSASVFIPAGGKVYNGTTYESSKTAKVFNGTQWVPIVTAKAYNGTQWVNLK